MFSASFDPVLVPIYKNHWFWWFSDDRPVRLNWRSPPALWSEIASFDFCNLWSLISSAPLFHGWLQVKGKPRLDTDIQIMTQLLIVMECLPYLLSGDCKLEFQQLGLPWGWAWIKPRLQIHLANLNKYILQFQEILPQGWLWIKWGRPGLKSFAGSHQLPIAESL